MWTVNSQMFKLVLEKAEEPEIKLPISTGSSKKQKSSRKTSIPALLTMSKLLTVWITINCGRFWKRWEYQTTWPACWKILMRVRQQHLQLDMEPNRKGVGQGCILSPCLFNSYAEYIMRNTGLDEAQAGIKITRRNINNLRYAGDTTVNYKLALTKSTANDWTTKAFAICLYGDWTLSCYSCWPSTTPEGVQGGGRHSVLQGIWWDRSLDSWMFLGTDFMISILASPHI